MIVDGVLLPTERVRALRWYATIEDQATDKDTLYDAYRWLGRNDLFFLMLKLLKRTDINRDWLFARCREVQAEPNSCLDLWARAHYKSTIQTFGKTIQDIISDPEITIGIFSHTRPIAKGFLNQIRREFEENDFLKHLYSDVLWADPKKEAPKWSEDGGIVVKRKSNPKESTVEAHGLVDGQPTSKHFRILLFDDVVTLENVSTGEQIEKTTKALEMAYNLGTSESHGGIRRFIGTRYSLYDTYSAIISRGGVKVRVYPATHNGRFEGKPVLLTQKEWDDKLRDTSRTTIASQQLQNPMADEGATFRTQWLKAYEVRPRTLNVYIMCDPSRGRSATSDNTAIAVVGVGAGGVKYLLDGFCHRMTLSQRWQNLRGLYHRWSAMRGVMHIECGYERYGAQSDDEYFDEQMDIEKTKTRNPNAKFIIQELAWPREGGNSKQERVERLEPDFRNGRFYLPLPVMHEGKPKRWRVDTNPSSGRFSEIEIMDGAGLTSLQMQAIDGGSGDLVAKPIICRDPALPGPRDTGGRYDLTLRFMDEYQTFPFGMHKDLIDATSRVYDMEPRAPISLKARSGNDPETYVDGM